MVRASFLLFFLVLAACGGGGGGGGGAVAPPVDDNALPLGATDPDSALYAATPASDPRLLIGATGNRLPARQVLTDLLPPVGTQILNSCVGWSIGYYLKTATERKEMGWNVTTASTNHFSPAFLYNQRPSRQAVPVGSPCRDRDGAQGCMNPVDALNTLVNLGCCRWGLMPGATSNGTTQPSATAIADAANYRAREYRRFGTDMVLADSDIDDVRSWLYDDGTPVTFAADVAEGWSNYRGAENGVCLDVIGTGFIAGGHMMTIVGYDDHIPTPNTGSFLVVNSWGVNWGADGYMWVPYAQLKLIWKFGFGVKDLPNAGPAPAPLPFDSNDVLPGAQAFASSASGAVGGLDFDPADWWKFTAAAGELITITLSESSGDLDMKLTNAAEVRLAASNNPGTANEEITYSFSVPGTYYLKIYPYADVQSPYRIDLARSQAQGNDLPSGATVAVLDTDMPGSVGGSDPRDWWRIDLGASEQATVRLTGLSDDLDLYLYKASDSDGTYWLRSWTGGSSDESITFTSSSTGDTYYVLVLPYGAAMSNYTLRIDSGSRPDLVTTSWHVNYTNFSDRVEVTVNHLKVENQGTADAGAFQVGVALSDGTAPGATYWLGSETWVNSEGLPAGWLTTWTDGMGTVSKAGLPAGSYFVLFKADSGTVIDEPDEFNNYAFAASAWIVR